MRERGEMGWERRPGVAEPSRWCGAGATAAPGARGRPGVLTGDAKVLLGWWRPPPCASASLTKYEETARGNGSPLIRCTGSQSTAGRCCYLL